MGSWHQALALFAATFVSEDAACIAAGLLMQRGELAVVTGIAACAAGIFVGDVGLWAAGRFAGRLALNCRALSDAMVLRRLREWLDRHAAGAIVGSRFLPGTRLPLYLLSGVVRVPAAVFAFWSLVGSLVWTPTLILLTASLGDAFVARLSPAIGASWSLRVAIAFGVWALIRTARSVASREGRLRVAARAARWSRWEFWPMWIFYAPVAIWVAYLAVRFRGLTTITAANPGMQDGGTVGESKAEILSKLPAEVTLPFTRIDAGSPSDRMRALREFVDARGCSFPLILKPDVGERGTAVRLVRSERQALGYLTVVTAPVIAQRYHPGPFEAGVFYYRMPGAARGRIFSITDKVFPSITGDGRSSLEQLVWRHPRLRMQADVFLARHQADRDRVLSAGEQMQMAIAGNHAQGTLFRDGAHLSTPALEERLDAIARSFDGFYVGRFDIRYSDVEAFKRGEDISIVELNGATAESTNIYDPSSSLAAAYRQLARQWSLVFAIGAANRARGAEPTSLRRLRTLVRHHLTGRPALPVSD